MNELFTFTEICLDKILHWGEETSTKEEEETERPNLTTVECDLPEEVNISNEQKQAYLDCKIVDLDKDEEYKSFEIKQIAGIPEDKTLSDKTAEAISNGQQLLDYSDEDNKYTYQAYFSAYEMNPAVTEES